MRAASNWSPAVVRQVEATTPPRAATATSVVPPPMSTTMWPSGWAMSIPAPRAAEAVSYHQSSGDTSAKPGSPAGSRLSRRQTRVKASARVRVLSAFRFPAWSPSSTPR